jgi:hypothetical protein
MGRPCFEAMITGVGESSNESFENAEKCPSPSIQLALTDRDQLRHTPVSSVSGSGTYLRFSHPGCFARSRSQGGIGVSSA